MAGIHRRATRSRGSLRTAPDRNQPDARTRNIPARGSVELLIRVETGSSVQVPLNLWQTEAFRLHDEQTSLILGLYFGIMLSMLLYNSFLCFSLRETQYAWYVGYVASITIFLASLDGLSFQYLWPDNPDWGNQALLVLLSLTLLFGMEFTRRFLSSDKNFPRIDRVALGLQALSLLGLAASFFMPYASLIRAIALHTVLVISVMMLMGTLGLLRGYRPARYFMIAWSMLLLGVMLYMLKIFGLVPHNALTQNGFQIGSLLEMVLLSLALASRVDELQRESVTDPLTKLSNRRFFDQRLDAEFERTERGDGPLGLLMVDIDHFKTFNDRYGHAEGDEVLKIVARALRDGVRRHDLVCRYGGEEFAVLLPGAGAHEAAQLGEVLRRAIEQRQFSRGPITVSIGAASTSDPKNRDPHTLFRVADDALYRAKAQGRNRVEADAA